MGKWWVFRRACKHWSTFSTIGECVSRFAVFGSWPLFVATVSHVALRFV